MINAYSLPRRSRRFRRIDWLVVLVWLGILLAKGTALWLLLNILAPSTDINLISASFCAALINLLVLDVHRRLR